MARYTVSKKVSDETLNQMIQIESGGNPTIVAGTSTATGLLQFINSTWLATVKKYRPDLLKGRTQAEVLNLRKDGKLSIELGARLQEENGAIIGTYAPGPLYLAHFSGPATARACIQAPANTPTSRVFSANAIKANRRILEGKTCGQVVQWANAKMSSGYKQDWVAKYYKVTNTPIQEAVKDVVTGGGAVVTGGIATHGVQQGWGLTQWAIFGIVVLVVCVVGFFGWRAIKKWRAEKDVVFEDEPLDEESEEMGIDPTLPLPIPVPVDVVPLAPTSTGGSLLDAAAADLAKAQGKEPPPPTPPSLLPTTTTVPLASTEAGTSTPAEPEKPKTNGNVG